LVQIFLPDIFEGLFIAAVRPGGTPIPPVAGYLLRMLVRSIFRLNAVHADGQASQIVGL